MSNSLMVSAKKVKIVSNLIETWDNFISNASKNNSKIVFNKSNSSKRKEDMSDINEMIKIKLRTKKDLIKYAVRNFTNQLGYSIFLKEYSIRNISELATLEMECQEMEGASKYEINFELLDRKLFTINDIYIHEKII